MLISDLKIYLFILITHTQFYSPFMNVFWYSFHQEEQRKIEEEKEKKKENDMVFKAWLQKKREQIVEMRRIQRAKQIEDMNNRVSETSLWKISIQIWKLNLLTERNVNIGIRTYRESRKSGPRTTLEKEAP